MALQTPAFAAAAISSLALGIGANAAVFSLIDAVLFRPFPVRSQNELVLLRSQRGVEVPTKVSLPDYRDFREGQEVCTDILAHARFDFSIRAGERTERVAGELVSWNYLDVLALPVSYGRSLTPAEEDIASPVVIISDRLWWRSFGEDLDTVGKTLLVNGHSLTVVGIAPPCFSGLYVGAEMDLWMPMSMLETLWPRVTEFVGGRDQGAVTVLGRLRPSVGLVEAQVGMQTLAAQLAEAYPDTNEDKSVLVESFDRARIADRGEAVSYFGLLSAVVFLVLVIACANVASLRPVEFAGRDGEMAMRRALGATQLQLADSFS